MSKTTVLSQIEQALAAAMPYSKKLWIDACPPGVQEQLLEVRKRYKEGRYTTSRVQVAKAVAAVACKHVTKGPSVSAVERWLEK